jgi:nicotinamide mononucleotide transporter
MGMPQELFRQFLLDLKNTGWLEFIAVLSGIVSVWYSRKEDILVYPTGLINTIVYVWLSFHSSLFGEASVNLYYTVLSIYGWILWSKKDQQHRVMLHVTKSSGKELAQQFIFFGTTYFLMFFALTYLKQGFAPMAIPWADAFAAGTAYTGMWLMTKKKVESWHWWIATNVASIPLYFVKHYVFTSVYYVILLILAIAGLIEWNKKIKSVSYGV